MQGVLSRYPYWWYQTRKLRHRGRVGADIAGDHSYKVMGDTQKTSLKSELINLIKKKETNKKLTKQNVFKLWQLIIAGKHLPFFFLFQNNDQLWGVMVTSIFIFQNETSFPQDYKL